MKLILLLGGAWFIVGGILLMLNKVYISNSTTGIISLSYGITTLIYAISEHRNNKI